jgi:hypothetical protein
MEIIKQGEIIIKDWKLRDKKFFEDYQTTESILPTLGLPTQELDANEFHRFYFGIEHKINSEVYSELFSYGCEFLFKVKHNNEKYNEDFIVNLINIVSPEYEKIFNTKKISTHLAQEKYQLPDISYLQSYIRLYVDNLDMITK